MRAETDFASANSDKNCREVLHTHITTDWESVKALLINHFDTPENETRLMERLLGAKFTTAGQLYTYIWSMVTIRLLSIPPTTSVAMLPLTQKNGYILMERGQEYLTTSKAIIGHPIYKAYIDYLMNKIKINYELLEESNVEFQLGNTRKLGKNRIMPTSDRAIIILCFN
ncbi:unnamed protein product [Hermetia illucens]|uniref:Uncharacterized protein n=1 Tax=Hermetia illucens TaxID=343691 RepID=A0A7R8UUG0_HERIL|nr:unnamed protein product [Hermetia illucens]